METASPQAIRRLMKELDALRKSPPGSSPDDLLLELRPYDADGEDLSEWYASIRGPPSGPYSKGTFELSILIPPNYPSKPPSMKFLTKIWHPNVSFTTGEVCLDVLAAQWSPAWNLESTCMAIVALMGDPEPDSPLNVDAAAVFRTGDRVAYGSMCRMYTEVYALPNGSTTAAGGVPAG